MRTVKYNRRDKFKRVNFSILTRQIVPDVWEGRFDWGKRYDNKYLLYYARMEKLDRADVVRYMDVLCRLVREKQRELNPEDPESAEEMAKSFVLQTIVKMAERRGCQFGTPRESKKNG